jgi:dephospho-CoA kinase
MLNLLKVAVTGSLSSGKSTVCRLFEQWGAYVVDADRVLHGAFSSDISIRQRIRALFGDGVFHGESIDRQRLANITIGEPKLLTQLENICHPYVNREIRRHYRIAVRARTYSLFVAEIPLLFESRFPLYSWFDTTVVVSCDRTHAKERYIRKGGTEEQFEFRSGRQMAVSEKVHRANYTLMNDGTLKSLEKAAKQLFNQFIEKN